MCNLLHVTGFHFSPDEPTALIQWEGGPCAVLAPVQAFIIKSLMSETWSNNWREVIKNIYIVTIFCGHALKTGFAKCIINFKII